MAIYSDTEPHENETTHLFMGQDKSAFCKQGIQLELISHIRSTLELLYIGERGSDPGDSKIHVVGIQCVDRMEPSLQTEESILYWRGHK